MHVQICDECANTMRLTSCKCSLSERKCFTSSSNSSFSVINFSFVLDSELYLSEIICTYMTQIECISCLNARR